MPIADVSAENDRDFPLLAIGIVDDVTANLSAIRRRPTGRVQEMQPARFEAQFDILHFFREFYGQLFDRTAARELDKAADVEFDPRTNS